MVKKLNGVENMTDKKMVEAMARLDGISKKDVAVPINDTTQPLMVTQNFKNDVVVYKLPAYLTSHDACLRVFTSLTTTQQCVILKSIIGEDFSRVSDISDTRLWCLNIIKYGESSL